MIWQFSEGKVLFSIYAPGKLKSLTMTAKLYTKRRKSPYDDTAQNIVRTCLHIKVCEWENNVVTISKRDYWPSTAASHVYEETESWDKSEKVGDHNHRHSYYGSSNIKVSDTKWHFLLYREGKAWKEPKGACCREREIPAIFCSLPLAFESRSIFFPRTYERMLPSIV